MSGLEIAGVILAVIPIFQIGLRTFHGDKSKALAKYQLTIGKISRKLDLEHAQLHNTCTRLFTPILGEDMVAELLSNPNAANWREVMVSERIQEHLGDSKFDLYVNTLKDLAACVISLRDELGLADMKADGRNSDKWYDRAAKRLKNSLKHKQHKELLDEIADCNSRLDRLVGNVLHMAPIKTEKRSKIDTKKWESLRKLAGGLHNTLEERLSCNCGHCHMAHLRLETRGTKEELEVKFGVLFTLDVYPRGWHETEITIIRSEASRAPSPPKVSSQTSRVKFSDPKDDKEEKWTPASPSLSDTRIEDLCQEFLKTRKEAGCIGFLEDNGNREYYIHSIWPRTTLGDDLSLAQLLSRKEKSGIPALLLRDKYELAVILATSVLQLHSTPWLDNSDWREDVRFVRAKDQKAPYAYIQKRFNSNTDAGSRLNESATSPLRRNETIFALGIVLIELSLGRSLRSFQTPEDLGPDGMPNFLTDLSIANRLILEHVQLKEGARYANTVNRCVNCIFDGIDPSLKDEQFRQAFYQSAVVPLHALRDDIVK